ncbi:MAG: type II toxin-antitoxin system RelE/ParE family toxin [Candidatus Thermoplasmatota archaeon]|jgi:mRNA interferase RelE/StbE|nr:type II toxin-antitoxin system RelE/ParE family toxin [Candidatus Thermoplasmatota archaeon]
MDYIIIWSVQASKQLKSLDRSIAKRIYEKVGQLRQNPERYVEKLFRYPYYRLRIGDYRVILDIQKEMVRIMILKVGHRSSIYDR